MGDHLKVDVDHIRTSAGRIRSVESEFKGADSLIDRYKADIGTSILTDKLDDFANNWKIHRDKTCDSLEKFAAWAEKAADAYDGTEDSLVKALKGKH